MKRKVLSILCLLLAAVISVTLCSCSVFESDISALLSPPTPEGEIKYIKDALSLSAGDDIIYKYPKSGEFRSPIITRDINSDGNEEAFAFFSSTDNGTLTMHISLIVKGKDGWKTSGDASVTAGGIDKVMFCDLDRDGAEEMVVGFSLYGDVDMQVAVLDFENGTPSFRLKEEYDFFLIHDLDRDATDDILVGRKTDEDKTAVAKLFSFRSDETVEKGSCSLDAGATSYLEPKFCMLDNTTEAVFIDAAKGKGMITELIYFKDNTLRNAFLDTATLENVTSYRDSAVECSDFDGDGILELPLTSLLQGPDVADPLYLTNWCSFDGEKLTRKASAYMNYTDGYYILFPDSWREKSIAVLRRLDMKLRAITLWDKEKSTSADELLRVRAIPFDDWEKSEISAYTEIARTETLVIAASVSNYEGEEKVTDADVKKMIGIIK